MMVRALRSLLLGFLLLALTACGGGGSSSGAGSTGPSNGIGATFNIDYTSLQLSAQEDAATMPGASLTLTAEMSPYVAYVGAGWQGSPPSWANVQVVQSGIAGDYTVIVRATTTTLSPGIYTATLLVGTSQQSGTLTDTLPVPVKYTVTNTLAFVSSSPAIAAIFGDTSSKPLALDVSGTVGKSWQVKSDSPWLVVPVGMQLAGATNFNATINPAGLPIGQQTAIVTITNAGNPSESAALKVSFTLAAPTLTVSPTPVVLGGANGESTPSQSLQMSLNTGTVSYPWAATFVTTDGSSWLSTNITSGTVGSTPQAITLSGDMSKWTSGTTTGTATLAATVLGQTFNAVIPVTFNVNPDHLQVTPNGIAFSSFPSSSTLTRTLTVNDTRGYSGITWSAASDQTWLTVTPSGTVGGGLVLTANPASLTADKEYIANVTLTTTDPRVFGSETARVGLWVGSTNPVQWSVSTGFNTVYDAVDPVEPYLFLNTTGSAIAVYNLYTGTSVASYSNISQKLSAMTVSSDGTTLYMVDYASGNVVPVDIASGAPGAAFTSRAQLTSGNTIEYVRPGAHGLLLTSMGDIFDTITGKRSSTSLPMQVGGYGASGGLMFATPNGSHVGIQAAGLLGGVPFSYSLLQDSIDYSSISNGTITVTPLTSLPSSSMVNSVAVSPDGSKLYVSSTHVSVFDTGNGSLLATISPSLAFASPLANTTTNVLFTPAGVAMVGAQNDGGSADIWTYDSSYNQLKSATLGGYPVVNADTLQISGDGAVICGWVINNPIKFYCQPAP